MALSNKLTAYDDVERAFRTAEMNPDGVTLVMKSNAAAVRWRQRAYYFRKLWIKEMRETMMHSSDVAVRVKAGTSPWDDLVLTIENNYVHIKHNADTGILEMIPANGVVPEEMTDTEVLNVMSGQAAPLIMGEGPLGLEIDHHEGFTEADAERARKAVADLMKE